MSNAETKLPLVAYSATAPEGRIYIAIGPNCWGKGNTPKKAVTKMRSNWPSYIKYDRAKFVVVECDSRSTVSSFDGSIEWPSDGEKAFKVDVKW